MGGFAAIRKRAAERKGGDKILQSLLGPAPDNKALARVRDDRVQIGRAHV